MVFGMGRRFLTAVLEHPALHTAVKNRRSIFANRCAVLPWAPMPVTGDFSRIC